jgi:hypothetical protein
MPAGHDVVDSSRSQIFTKAQASKQGCGYPSRGGETAGGREQHADRGSQGQPGACQTSQHGDASSDARAGRRGPVGDEDPESGHESLQRDHRPAPSCAAAGENYSEEHGADAHAGHYCEGSDASSDKLLVLRPDHRHNHQNN